jgi:tRNA pseudouridine55 synthase
MKLGETSTTGDSEGEKTKTSDKKPSEKQIQEATSSFLGEIGQIPPAYSAIKVNGKRAYKLARGGKEVKLEPRKVKIYEITDVKYQYPLVSFTVRVSSGTYIRSLVEDIGEKLDTGAYLAGLCRTQVGDYDIGSSLSIFEIDSNIGLTLEKQMKV